MAGNRKTIRPLSHYSLGDLVMAKLGEHPYWPAEIRKCHERKHYLEWKLPEENKLWCNFVGDESGNWVHIDFLRAFNPANAKRWKCRVGVYRHMQAEAIAEAEVIYQRRLARGDDVPNTPPPDPEMQEDEPSSTPIPISEPSKDFDESGKARRHQAPVPKRRGRQPGSKTGNNTASGRGRGRSKGRGRGRGRPKGRGRGGGRPSKQVVEHADTATDSDEDENDIYRADNRSGSPKRRKSTRERRPPRKIDNTHVSDEELLAVTEGPNTRRSSTSKRRHESASEYSSSSGSNTSSSESDSDDSLNSRRAAKRPEDRVRRFRAPPQPNGDDNNSDDDDDNNKDNESNCDEPEQASTPMTGTSLSSRLKAQRHPPTPPSSNKVTRNANNFVEPKSSSPTFGSFNVPQVFPRVPKPLGSSHDALPSFKAIRATPTIKLQNSLNRASPTANHDTISPKAKPQSVPSLPKDITPAKTASLKDPSTLAENSSTKRKRRSRFADAPTTVLNQPEQGQQPKAFVDDDPFAPPPDRDGSPVINLRSGTPPPPLSFTFQPASSPTSNSRPVPSPPPLRSVQSNLLAPQLPSLRSSKVDMMDIEEADESVRAEENDERAPSQEEMRLSAIELAGTEKEVPAGIVTNVKKPAPLSDSANGDAEKPISKSSAVLKVSAMTNLESHPKAVVAGKADGTIYELTKSALTAVEIGNSSSVDLPTSALTEKDMDDSPNTALKPNLSESSSPPSSAPAQNTNGDHTSIHSDGKKSGSPKLRDSTLTGPPKPAITSGEEMEKRVALEFVVKSIQGAHEECLPKEKRDGLVRFLMKHEEKRPMAKLIQDSESGSSGKRVQKGVTQTPERVSRRSGLRSSGKSLLSSEIVKQSESDGDFTEPAERRNSQTTKSKITSTGKSAGMSFPDQLSSKSQCEKNAPHEPNDDGDVRTEGNTLDDERKEIDEEIEDGSESDEEESKLPPIEQGGFKKPLPNDAPLKPLSGPAPAKKQSASSPRIERKSLKRARSRSPLSTHASDLRIADDRSEADSARKSTQPDDMSGTSHEGNTRRKRRKFNLEKEDGDVRQTELGSGSVELTDTQLVPVSELSRLKELMNTKNHEFEEKCMSKDKNLAQKDVVIAQMKEKITRYIKELAEWNGDISKKGKEVVQSKSDATKVMYENARKDRELVEVREEITKCKAATTKKDEEIERYGREITKYENSIAQKDEVVARLKEEISRCKEEIQELKDDRDYLRDSLVEKDALLNEYKVNPSKVFVDLPDFPEAEHLELPDDSRVATEVMRPEELCNELEGLRLTFEKFREKVRNATTMRKTVDERIRMLESEFDCSKQDIAIMEETAVEDEVEITRSLGKLFVAKINPDTLIQTRAAKVVKRVVSSCKEMPQIHTLGVKLLKAWDEQKETHRAAAPGNAFSDVETGELTLSNERNSAQ